MNTNTTTTALLSVFGPEVLQQRRTAKHFVPAKLNLEAIANLLDRAAAAVLAIIREHIAPVPNVRGRQEQWELRGYQLGETYARAVDLFDEGHFDEIDSTIASEVMQRASQKANWPDPADTAGLALIDIFLRDFCDAVKPLLATQDEFLLAA